MNDYSSPSITVWRGFAFRWFGEFRADGRIWSGLVNSLVIAVAMMALPLAMGLAVFVADGHFSNHMRRMRELYAERRPGFLNLRRLAGPGPVRSRVPATA